MRRNLLIVISIVVSAVFLWWVLRDVPMAEVGESILGADWRWLLVSLAFGALSLWARAVRWRGLLDFRLPMRPAFYIMGVTFMLNQLPLRAGEIARSFLATRYNVPFMTAATSVVVERLVDTLLVVLLITVGFSSLPHVPAEAAQAASLFGLFSGLGFVIMLILSRFSDLAHRLLALLLRYVPLLRRLPLESMLNNVLDGLKPITTPSRLGHFVLWTLISWAFSLLTLYPLFMALGIAGPDVDGGVNRILGTVLGITLAAFSIAIPVTVAAIGPFEGALLLSGNLIGLPEITSISLGFLFHGVSILLYVVAGIVGLLGLGVSLGDLMQAADQPERQPDESLTR